VEAGTFREDLLARINLWTFRLPGLRERPEDIEPNLEYEVEQYARTANRVLSFSREARERFLSFATSAEAAWTGNFRDFNAAIRRMATLSTGGRIGVGEVTEEVERLRASWARARPREAAAVVPAASSPVSSGVAPSSDEALIARFLGGDVAATLDDFDRVQLARVLRVCLGTPTLSDAGRHLFDVSRTRKKIPNDADRLRKYLARFGLAWSDIHA
jgi:transcriptional regulatory protein RtcR